MKRLFCMIAIFAATQAFAQSVTLNKTDVERIIAQAVAQAEASNLKAVIAVVDKEGNALGVFQMNATTRNLVIKRPDVDARPGVGLEGDLQSLIRPSTRLSAKVLAVLSKAGTGAFLSTQGHAFSTRTASFIVQEHFPPAIGNTGSGPLFGVQFSSLLCSDINPRLPLGLSADPGGLPLYKNGILVGGIGVEGDGIYTFDADPKDFDQPVEELVAVAATRGFEAPAAIRANQIIVNGLRFPYVNVGMPSGLTIPTLQGRGTILVPFASAPASQFQFVNVQGFDVRISPNFFPAKAGQGLSAAEVTQILVQAIRQANITRAAIRRPLNSPAQVNATVVDAEGKVLGIMSTPDAPVFGFDVSAQKARTAAFLSHPNAAALLRTLDGGKLAKYVDSAAADGLAFNGSVAFSDRAGGFLSRPFFPDGIDGTAHGPFSVPIEVFSPFNDGLQLDMLLTQIAKILRGKFDPAAGDRCTLVPNLPNGLQIFPGSVPLYKNGVLVGAIGISGDGVDQDDLIAAMGSAGFEAPPGIRSDRVFVRKVRLPFVKFPRHPNL